MPPEPDSVLRAKALRRSMSPPEARLWQWLRTRPAGLKFRRQHPIGRYVIDFYRPALRLAIEIDGEAHSRGSRPLSDADRGAWCRQQGIVTRRIAATEVLRHLDGVSRAVLIWAVELGHAPLHHPADGPPPQQAGEELA